MRWEAINGYIDGILLCIYKSWRDSCKSNKWQSCRSTLSSSTSCRYVGRESKSTQPVLFACETFTVW